MRGGGMRQTKSALLSVVLGAALIGCPGPRGAQTIPPPSTNDTTVGSGDVFDVRVYGEEELSGTYRVGPDGSIDFPLVGAVQVVGLEPSAVAETLRTRLVEGQFLVDPHVSVFVQEYASKRVSVVGEVSRPGTFSVTTGMTLVQAISLAGGFTEMADRDGTTLTRQVEGEARQFHVPRGRHHLRSPRGCPRRGGGYHQRPTADFLGSQERRRASLAVRVVLPVPVDKTLDAGSRGSVVGPKADRLFERANVRIRRLDIARLHWEQVELGLAPEAFTEQGESSP